jgi:transcription antitermination factor NusG
MSLSHMDVIGEEPAGEPQAAHWYAAYTLANHEKRVGEQLGRKGVKSFLPMYESTRQWKDRRVRLQLPLFPGYVFVRIALSERLAVLRLAGVARLVGFGDRPAPLSDEEMEGLRRGTGNQLKMEPHPYVSKGQRVRILRGPLAGMEGVLLRNKGNFRLVISIDLIMRSIVVDVDGADIHPIEARLSWRESNATDRGLACR